MQYLHKIFYMYVCTQATYYQEPIKGEGAPNLAYTRGLRPVKPRFLIWDVTKCLQLAGVYVLCVRDVTVAFPMASQPLIKQLGTLHVIMAMWVEPLTKRDHRS